MGVILDVSPIGISERRFASSAQHVSASMPVCDPRPTPSAGSRAAVDEELDLVSSAICAIRRVVAVRGLAEALWVRSSREP